MPTTPDEVLTFWLGPPEGDPFAQTEKWWRKDAALDAEIAARFGEAVAAGASGALDAWIDDARSAVALVILLDQFSRNIHRGSAKAFASDPKAVEVTRAVIRRGDDHALPPTSRLFLYMPLMHAEDLGAQGDCIIELATLLDEAPSEMRDKLVDNVLYAVKHRRIIERFGRFPHRNTTLGRTSTADEVAFLKEPGSSF